MSEDGGRVLPFPRRNDPDVAVEAAVEAALFAAGEPMNEADLAAAIDGVTVLEVLRALNTLRSRYAHPRCGLDLSQVAGGWQVRTDPRQGEVVRRVRGGRPLKLSRAALEVLSIIAYEQPATRMEVDRIRGVDCGNVIRALVSRGLVRVAGRRDIPGRPLEYRTTRRFLETFSLARLSDLPTLDEVRSLGSPLEE